MAISRPYDALGSGQASYNPDRPIMHFGTPPAVAEAALRIDRLRSRGFLLDSKEAD